VSFAVFGWIGGVEFTLEPAPSAAP